MRYEYGDLPFHNMFKSKNNERKNSSEIRLMTYFAQNSGNQC